MKVHAFATAAICLMLPLSNASPSNNIQVLPRAAKSTWSYDGCYSSFPIAWSANVTSHSITNDLTPKKCQQACYENGLSLAALTHGNECYCHGNLDPLNQQINNGQCKAVCSGDKNAKCGGSDGELGVWVEKGKKLKKTKAKTKIASSALSLCKQTRKNGKSKTVCDGKRKAEGLNLPVPVVGLVGSVVAVGLMVIV